MVKPIIQINSNFFKILRIKIIFIIINTLSILDTNLLNSLKNYMIFNSIGNY